jgi:hypothetical protein
MRSEMKQRFITGVGEMIARRRAPKQQPAKYRQNGAGHGAEPGMTKLKSRVQNAGENCTPKVMGAAYIFRKRLTSDFSLCPNPCRASRTYL